jgi:hypothetical protein
MTRLFSLGLLGLLAFTPALAAEDLRGVWKQETEGIGVSFWELTPRAGEQHAYDAQEYGLGGVRGIARLEDGHLVIHFGDDPRPRNTYKWKLEGTRGRGHFTGGDGTVFDKSVVKFIGK